MVNNLALPYFAAGLPLNVTAQMQIATSIRVRISGIADLDLRKPSELSGGQAQRVALARAVLLNPKALADEPTASL